MYIPILNIGNNLKLMVLNSLNYRLLYWNLVRFKGGSKCPFVTFDICKILQVSKVTKGQTFWTTKQHTTTTDHKEQKKWTSSVSKDIFPSLILLLNYAFQKCGKDRLQMLRCQQKRTDDFHTQNEGRDRQLIHSSKMYTHVLTYRERILPQY